MRRRNNSIDIITLVLFCVILNVFATSVLAQKTALLRSVTIITEPNASVWINDVNYGKTDAKGNLTIKTVSSGVKNLRVRAYGFKEMSQTMTAVQKGDVKITLVKTTDESEITFQQAEIEKDKQKSIELYQKAVKLNPRYAPAWVALARAFISEADSESALKAIANARKARLGYSEASAVEGRIFMADGEETKAIASFKRAITEGRGFQPEAHTGLGLLYKEKAEGIGASGDFEGEKANYAIAASELKIAISQLSGAPDAEIIYQLLGDLYEKSKNYKQAIATYEEFLRIFPDSNDASAVSSMIVQLKKQMEEN
jgi:tetratricopeptide (TPR) repeat protein